MKSERKKHWNTKYAKVEKSELVDIFDHIKKGTKKERKEAKERLILSLTPLIKNIAVKIGSKNPAMSLDDLKQAGYVAAWEMIETYDASRGTKFSVYAWRGIHNKIMNDVYTQGILVGTREEIRIMFSVKADISEHVLLRLDAKRSRTDEEEQMSDIIADTEMSPAEVLNEKHERAILLSMIDKLTDLEKICVMKRFYEHKQMPEIAADIGVKIKTVDNAMNRAMKRLRRSFLLHPELEYHRRTEKHLTKKAINRLKIEAKKKRICT